MNKWLQLAPSYSFTSPSQCLLHSHPALWQKSGPPSPSRVLVLFRYEYDDHYFLTDSKEFIYEFFPLQPEWQLLRHPITLQEFEELPFVRSLFFRYGLCFPDEDTKAVMHTDSTGTARELVRYNIG